MLEGLKKGGISEFSGLLKRIEWDNMVSGKRGTFVFIPEEA